MKLPILRSASLMLLLAGLAGCGGGDGGSGDPAATNDTTGGNNPSTGPSAGGSGSANPPAVLVGAGDIANCGGMEAATATLLDGIAGTVFTTGDNVYPNGAAAEYTNCYEPTWGRHKARTRPSPGNHDYGTAGAVHYYNYFGASAGPAGLGYYSYDLGDWHIVVLNSNIARTAGSTQEQWLRADLAANTKQCTLAYWHHPLFNSGATHGNNTSVAPLYKALYDYKADVIVNGHEHIYERFAPQDVNGVADPNGPRQFTGGTGGVGFYAIGSVQPNSEVRDNVTHGVIKFTLRATSYDWQFVPIAGRTFTDTGTETCRKSRAPAGPPTAGTQRTLTVTDGWDSKNQKTIVNDGKLFTVLNDDTDYFEVESGFSLALQFSQLSAAGSLSKAMLYFTHHEAELFTAESLILETGKGVLATPTITSAPFRPVVVEGVANETTIAWDVTALALDSAQANDLKIIVRNVDPGFKKARVDRAYLVVTYGP
jgi:Calcineurin-like phosphoesterase